MSRAREAELIVKIDPTRTDDPAGHVRQLLDTVAPSASTEEVFPGLRRGASAGLVSVRLPCARGSKLLAASLAVLRRDAAVKYVETPKARHTSR